MILNGQIRGYKCKYTAKVHDPVSEASVLKHIKGKESQIFYVLLKDGNIRFGAIDFDMKPGKENNGYSFEDVKKLLGLLKKWEIPYGIARSTGNGFHVYIFIIGAPYPAIKFRAIIYRIFEMTKITINDDGRIRLVPEVFLCI